MPPLWSRFSAVRHVAFGRHEPGELLPRHQKLAQVEVPGDGDLVLWLFVLVGVLVRVPRPIKNVPWGMRTISIGTSSPRSSVKTCRVPFFVPPSTVYSNSSVFSRAFIALSSGFSPSRDGGSSFLSVRPGRQMTIAHSRKAPTTAAAAAIHGGVANTLEEAGEAAGMAGLAACSEAA